VGSNPVRQTIASIPGSETGPYGYLYSLYRNEIFTEEGLKRFLPIRDYLLKHPKIGAMELLHSGDLTDGLYARFVWACIEYATGRDVGAELRLDILDIEQSKRR
jgi:hypothetical protein